MPRGAAAGKLCVFRSIRRIFSGDSHTVPMALTIPFLL